MTHYNTTHILPRELSAAEAKTSRQDAEVLAVFRRRGRMSPWEAHEALVCRFPITSVRRSITDLTKGNLLRRTDEKRRGPYGSPSYTWEPVPDGSPEQMQLFG
jgi:hypothetical protein